MDQENDIQLSNLKNKERRFKRDYKGSPIEFFREKYSHTSISRGELAERDYALYRALIRYGQINEAIPEIKKGYQKEYAGRKGPSEYAIKDILEAYKRHNGNATLVSKITPYSDTTIRRIWKRHNLPIIRKRSGQRRYKYF